MRGKEDNVSEEVNECQSILFKKEAVTLSES